MRYVCAAVFCLVVSDISLSQDSRADMYGGYSYVNIDTNDLSSRQNANGWEAAVARWYRGACGRRRAVQGLGPWSIRASADYVFTRYNIFGGPSVTQNNVRGGVGSVYSFGARHESETVAKVAATSAPPVRPQSPEPPPQRSAPPAQPIPRLTGAGMKLDALGVTVKLGRSTGAEITDEDPNGIAALAELHPGDVTNAVDRKPVRTPMELAAELANRQASDSGSDSDT